jgi:hypothetical protein
MSAWWTRPSSRRRRYGRHQSQQGRSIPCWFHRRATSWFNRRSLSCSRPAGIQTNSGINFMNENTSNLVMMIMAVGSFLQSMFFGTIFLFMFKWFPTRKEIELQEENQKMRHKENQDRFHSIETDIKQLLKNK